MFFIVTVALVAIAQASVLPDILFCHNKEVGLYCHPSESRVQVYCAGPTAVPVRLSCPPKHSCRTHRKLEILDGGKSSLKKHFPQCVPAELLDLDAFCEDKVYAHNVDNDDAMDTVTLDRIEEVKLRYLNSTETSNERILTATHLQCNPFEPNHKQLLQCAVIYKECGQIISSDDDGNVSSSKNSTCVSTRHISVFVDDCPAYDVCRQFEEDAGSYKFAKCVNPVHAMCLDRFWSMYADKYQNHVKEPILKFDFCDPYITKKKLHCQLELGLGREPVPPTRYSAQDDFQLRIQTKFPDLYSELFNVDNPAPQVTTIEVKRIEIGSSFCPDENIDLSAVERNTDPRLAATGPVCKQLSQTFARCMPKPLIEVRAEELKAALAKLESHTNEINEVSTVLYPASYLGFCLAYSTPGQYCIPGTPENGVVCPQGKVLHCQRPPMSDRLSWSDIGETPRCIQHSGVFPKIGDTDYRPNDPFRSVPIVNAFGEPLLEGNWASCEIV